MNFPGLDPAWMLANRALYAMGRERAWSLAATRATLARGEKVLVVVTTALGDSLLTLPLIETLAHHLGRERVSLLVKAPYAELYRDDPRIGHVFTVRGKYRWEGLREELRADPHRIALLANITEPDLLPYLWQCGVRGFLRYRTRWTRFPEWMANREMLREPGSEEYATGHAIENNLAMAEALGLPASSHRLAFPNLMRTSKQPRVIIHPGASRAIKRWPVENWAKLADEIFAEFKLSLLITGDARERELAKAVQGAMKRPAQARSATGDLSLRELVAAQAESLAFLSGDTGPYHLAVAVGCPTLTLFAPIDRGSSVEACGPHQANPALHRALETSDLGIAVSTISYERVWAETQALLKEVRRT